MGDILDASAAQRTAALAPDLMTYCIVAKVGFWVIV